MTDEDSSAIERLHEGVTTRATDLAKRHTGRLHCARGCADCCVDEISVFDVEAERIRRAHPELLQKGTPAPPGRCAFLDAAGACRIYEVRPYVCRTQGLPLRWLEEDDSGEIVEQRDICPLNLQGPSLGSLPEDAFWQLGPSELELSALQAKTDGAHPLKRVGLRSLFRRQR